MRIVFSLVVLFLIYQVEKARPFLILTMWILIIGLALRHTAQIRSEWQNVKEVVGIGGA